MENRDPHILAQIYLLNFKQQSKWKKSAIGKRGVFHF